MNLNQLCIYQNVQHTEMLHSRYHFYQTIGEAYSPWYSQTFFKINI
jgi:hypothetical protein